MAQIQFNSVIKNYGKVEVIKNFNLDVSDGEMIVIVGASGCGKSTLLRMLAGLETITSGEISIDGRVVNNIEPDKRNIAMVFQNYALYPHMSVFKNMAYGLKIAKIDSAEIKKRVDKAAAMLQLDQLLDRKPHELSGGQRQRVAMGRAIVREPSAFLFDEPLSNLDAKLRVAMRIQIKELQKSLGVTSLYVTHDQVEAMTLADRVVLMNNGIAEQIGRPMELYNQPATRFVADFIGSPPMNFFTVPALHSSLLEELSQRTGGNVDFKEECAIGIRPEHLHVFPAGRESQATNSNSEALLEGEILFNEALGSEVLNHIKIPDGSLLIAKSSSEEKIYDSGQKVGLGFSASHLHLFDKNGKRILLKS